MTEPTVAALVCEGQSDVPIFREIIHELWPSIKDVRSLQPELDEMERSRGRSGWSEVKSWCKQHDSHLDEVLNPFVGDRIDILLIAIDSDIAIEAGIADPPRPYHSGGPIRIRHAHHQPLRKPQDQHRHRIFSGGILPAA